MSVKRVLVLCLSIVIAHSSLVSCCNYDEQDKRAHCVSFKSLKAAGNQPDWEKLNVVNSGKSPFGPVEKDAFKDTPNVVDLQIKGLANDIQEGAFDGLVNLYEMHLDDNKLNVIQKGAFANLPMVIIYIYFCDVKEIRPKAFERLPKLRYVYIFGNHISNIEEEVFSDTDLSHVMLRKNEIKSVAINAFGDMPNLVFLSLEENELLSFEPQLLVGTAARLTHLYINRNKLTKITRDMFAAMPNLQVLLININSIERLGTHAFRDLKKLRLLDMSNNRLEEIKSNVFDPKGMKDLTILFIHDNQLSFLSSGVLVRLPNLQRMSIGGNPWQCPCWTILENFMDRNNITKLCYEEYSKGSRPFCVFSDVYPKDCIYDIENVRDMPQIFTDTLKEYTKLPPVCNVDGVAKPVLGA